MSRRGRDVYEILRHVRPIVLGSARVVESRVQHLGWTVGSRAVVEVLAAGGPMTVPGVAARLSLARQNVQRQVDLLVGLGQVETVANPSHRRSVLVQLTAEGRLVFARLHADEIDDLAVVALDCTDAELRTAAKVLAALDTDIRLRAITAQQEAL